MSHQLLVRARDLAPGTTGRDLFGRDGPLVLEIGVGGGRFLASLAAERSEWNLLGVDLSSPSVYRAFRKVRRRAPENVRLYRGDGRFVVRDGLEARSLHGVYVNFPDPWPKAEHADRRLLRRPFFRELAHRLESGGWVELTTDHRDYFERAVRQGEESGWFSIRSREPSERALATRYAEKWKAEDRSFYAARFVKRRHPSELDPSIELVDMQHAVLEGSLPVPDSFEKLVDVSADEERTVIVLDAMRVAGREKLLFMVRSEERYLVQEFLVEARMKEDRIVLGVERFARPLPTEAVARSVEMLTDWLEERGRTVLYRSY